MNSGTKRINKSDYLTDKEIYEIETAIYNNMLETLYKDVPKTVEGYADQETIKALVKEEEYVHIPGQEEFILTKSGRIYNTERIKSVAIHYSGRNIRVYLKGKKKEYNSLYKYAGWEYDSLEILKTFKKNKWDVRVQDNYRQFFESL